MRVQRGFDLDPSCKLWLPFYRYGGEQTKIWDMSGNNNHGTITGAIPATYPKLKGVELVTNGGMEADANWTTMGAVTTNERSSTQKHSGSYSRKLVLNGISWGGIESNSFSVVAGRRYKASGWIYGDGANFMYGDIRPTSGGELAILTDAIYPASWTYFETILSFSTTETAIMRFFKDSGNFTGTCYFDDVSVQEVTGYEGLGWGFDGVDDNINIPSWGSTITGTIFSGLCWVRNTYRGANVSRIFYTYNAVGDKGFSFYLGATRILGIDIWSSDPAAYASTVSIQDDTWVCLGYVYDGTAKTVDFYVNGILQVQRDITTHGDLNSNTTAYVCCSVSASQYITGQIGEVLIFNRALSAQEIRNYYELTRSRYGV